MSMLFVERGGKVCDGENVEVGERRACVVIDAGHGGDDPGKIGVNGIKEKEVNLEIALLVKEFLEANDIKVVMTREDDDGLYDRSASNKKVQDMKNRIALIEEAKADIVVSIHQNSYPEEYVHAHRCSNYSKATREETGGASAASAYRKGGYGKTGGKLRLMTVITF